MAKLLLINSATEKAGLQEIGDIVGVYEDSHQFSQTTLEKFDIFPIKGSVADVRAKLDAITPTIKDVYKYKSDGAYHEALLTKEQIDAGDAIVEAPILYQPVGSTKWYRLEKQFKFKATVKDLTNLEKSQLANTDIKDGTLTSSTLKMGKEPLTVVGNDVEFKDKVIADAN